MIFTSVATLTSLSFPNHISWRYLDFFVLNDIQIISLDRLDLLDKQNYLYQDNLGGYLKKNNIQMDTGTVAG